MKIIDSKQSDAAIKEALNERMHAVVLEMQDQPDQLVYGLTRDQVAKLHGSWEVRHDDEDTYSGGDRSLEGMKRASKYAPELKSDYLPDGPTDNEEQIRPAGLQAYDFDFEYPEDSDEDEESEPDWSGEDNIYEADMVDAETVHADASAILGQVIQDAIQTGRDVELVLNDGSSVYLDPHTLTAIKNAKRIDCLSKYTGSIAEFSTFLQEIYGPDAGKIHDESADWEGDE